MLSSLSWNIFFTAIALIAGGYYTISALLLYRGEITLWFKSRSPATPASPVQAVVKPAAARSQSDSIIGSISLHDGRSDARSSTLSAEDFIIAEEETSNTVEQIPSVPVRDDLLIGTIADLLEEIKTVSQLVADTDIDKAEAESLLRTLLSRYPNIASGSFRDAVTLYVCKELNERAAFDVSMSDAASWWAEKNL